MPHQCTSCGYVFSDGSKEMLSGCPECSGTTFQFHPNALSIPESPSDESPPTDSESRVEKHLGKATSKVRRLMSSSDSTTAGDTSTVSDTTTVGDESPSAAIPSKPSGSEPSEKTRTESMESFSGDPNQTETITAKSIGAGSGTTKSTSTSEPVDSQPNDSSDPSIDQRDTSAAHDEHERTGGADVLDDTDDVREKEDAAQATARSELISSDILAARDNDSTASESSSSEMDSIQSRSRSDSSSRSLRSRSDSSSSQSPPNSATEPHGPSPPPSDGRIVRSPTGEQPDLSDLRRELNDQFESIKIVEPGEYELNLMDLYDREEYIIALQENGRYVIQMPETWIDDDTD